MASARGHETYEFLRDCFSPVWKEVEELMANPVVQVDGMDYTPSFVCGSDYKVVQHKHMHHVCCTLCTYIAVLTSHDGAEPCHLHICMSVVHCLQGREV